MPRWTAEQWFIVLAIAFVAVFEARHLLGRGARLAARAFRPSGWRNDPSDEEKRPSVPGSSRSAVRSDPLGEEGHRTCPPGAGVTAPPSSPNGRRHGGPEKVPGSAKSAAARSDSSERGA